MANESPKDAILRALTQGTPATQQELREKYQRILEEVGREPDDCPICKSSAWNVGDVVDVHVRHTPYSHDELAASLGGVMPQVYVYVPVTCSYCGYTLFFHSGVLDARDSEEVKAKPPLRFAKRPRRQP
jgi:predicted nucleic-acid-binding Zn-ribbon protein